VTGPSVLLIGLGLFFLAISAVGMLLFPDFYTRAHVVAKSETLGIVLVIVGIVVGEGFGDGSWRLLLLVAFAAVANPTAVHALARAYATELDPTPDDIELPVPGEPYSPDAREPRGEAR
jgi:multicomponent Na+:H+ antiporter subunit G